MPHDVRSPSSQPRTTGSRHEQPVRSRCRQDLIARGLLRRGCGRIAVPLRAAGFTVKTVELDPKNVKELKKLDFKDVLEADFCDNAAVDRYIGAVDAVGMNPPFNKQQDMKHVRQAFTYLKDGGILVAIMSPAWTYRSDKLSQSFRQLVKRYRGDWSELPENTFAESGTNVRTGILTIAKHE